MQILRYLSTDGNKYNTVWGKTININIHIRYETLFARQTLQTRCWRKTLRLAYIRQIKGTQVMHLRAKLFIRTKLNNTNSNIHVGLEIYARKR